MSKKIRRVYHDENSQFYFAINLAGTIEVEFQEHHLTGRTSNSVSVKRKNYKEYDVLVKPRTYNQELFLRKGVIRNTGRGYYSSYVDKEGGKIMGNPTGYHKDFLDKCISHTIEILGYKEV